MPSKLTSRLVLGAMVLGLSCFLTLPGVTTAADAPASAPAAKLDPIKTATFVPSQGFQVNGKPFFPILLYSAKTSPEELAEFHKQGYNTLSVNKAPDAQNAADAGFYLAQHAYPKNPPTQLQATLFGIAMDSPNVNYKKDTLTKTKDDLAKVQKMIPDRPVFNAIGYWYNPQDIDNEASAVAKNLLPEKAQYEDLINTIDVSALYLYPVPHQPVSTVADAVTRAKKATGGKKALLPILQLFTWTEKDRYPTPAELREMVWLAVAAGADGIGYYDYSYVSGKKNTNIAKEQPELWQAAGAINADLKELAAKTAGLKEVTPTADIKSGKPTIRQWGDDKKGVLLIVAGEEPSSLEIKFKGPYFETQRTYDLAKSGAGYPTTDTTDVQATNTMKHTYNTPAHQRTLVIWGDKSFAKFQ